ncbi:MAG: M23 family metallopeptidase [Bacteroidales bacterium]|nr:M23 family metallopeptidase [Bacteroidales bacterium]
MYIASRMEIFFYSPETLQYKKVETTRKQKFFRFLSFTVPLLFLFVAFFFISEYNLNTPRLNRLMEEQEQLASNLSLINQSILRSESILDGIAFNDDHIYRVFFEVAPWPASMREAGAGGSNDYQDLLNFRFSDIAVNTHRNIDNLSRKLLMQTRSFEEIISLARNKEAFISSRPAIQPVSIKDLTRFGSAFGMRMHPILKVMRPHNGIDLTAPLGTRIYATADGIVVSAGYTTGGFGRRIVIDHGFGYETLYGHCHEILVNKGDTVKRGEVIGYVGNTGLSLAPHLHYEVHVNGRPVNPINYYANDLSAEEYEKMITLLSDADPSFDIN